MASIQTQHTYSASPVSRPPLRDPRPGRRSSGWRLVVIPLLVFIAVGVAGGAYLLGRPVAWQSGASLAILPRPSTNAANQASYYDTLSRGQIVSTAAKVADDAVGRTGTPSVSVLVVPETSVITLTVKADSTNTASSVAAKSLVRATQAINSLKLPYEATVIDDGTGVPTKVTPSVVKDAAVVVVVGLALAAAAQQLQAALRRRKGRQAGQVH